MESSIRNSIWVPAKAVELGSANVLIFGFAIFGLFTANPLETFWSFILLWILLKLFWWKEFPPVLVYGTLIPWIEVHVSAFEANFYDLPLDELYDGTGRSTFWMASIGLFAVCMGLKFGMNRKGLNQVLSKEMLIAAAQKLDQTRLLLAIFGVRIAGGFVQGFLGFGSSLQQLATYFFGIGEVLAVCLYLNFFVTRKRPLLFFTFFAFELLTSFYSYFGSWKGPVLLLFLTSLWNINRVTNRALMRFMPAFLLLGTLLFTWQAVKVSYREFLSNEEGQVLRVTQSEALGEFVRLASETTTLSQEERIAIFSGTLRRVGYLEYFNAVVEKVPNTLPFESGKLLKENLNFALVPRILNPNKGVKSDRDKVEKYTDYNFGGERNKSSFSLGHYCEAYIDWGPYGMQIQLFFYGIIGAFLWSLTRRRYHRINPVFLIGLLWVVMLPWGTMQQDMITIVGKTVWGAVCHLFIFHRGYFFLEKFVTVK